MSLLQIEEPSTCIAKSASRAAIRFHLSLNVADLDRASNFFRIFLGVEPAKCRPDYAKFELDNPPVVLSLEPFKAKPGGNLNHLGFRMPDSATLIEFQSRLETNGFATQREDGVECCYARQTKFWVNDPDGNLWEIYTLDEDIEHRGAGQIPSDVLPTKSNDDSQDPAAAIWAHRLGERFPSHLPVGDASVDQVMLQGTFNSDLPANETPRILAEVRRVLKPGGQVLIHVLTGNKPLPPDAKLSLPGPAAAVRQVPVDELLIDSLTAAGFADAHYTKRAEAPCFIISGVEMRETKIAAAKV
jgi:catechol 2,3-dioxygenase-like lactoylglutathione lyase family enzyme